MAFFFENIKIIRCQKDIVGNHLKTQVLIKNLNLLLKKKEDLKEKRQKKQNNDKFCSKSLCILTFLKFSKKIFKV